MTEKPSSLRLKHLGIDTYNEAVVYMREDCHICRSEGFEAQSRVQVTLGNRSLIATLNTIESDLLAHDEASLSEHAWEFLHANTNDPIIVSHPKAPESLSYIRAKLYGNTLSAEEISAIIKDILAGQLSDIHISMFLSGTVGNRLNKQEICDLTSAMIKTGQRMEWPSHFIVDKHCVGGLPGNRTTLIVVPIVAAFGLMIPKTSSRAITSPAGTADTMEVFAPVNLDIPTIKKVVEQENGCIVWGGSVSLSPADDLLIRIERTMNLDSEGQMIASILSKKIAAGSNHIVIDMPIGLTAKVRSFENAELLKHLLESVGEVFGVQVRVIFSDGSQPVGRGIGPALEARDVLAVLSNAPNAPQDLRRRALTLAGELIEFSPNVRKGDGKAIATALLDNGKALRKFEAICKAQGGMFEIPTSPYQHTIYAKKSGKITAIDNRLIARLAKLAGAPKAKSAGLELFSQVNMTVEKDQPLFVIHAENRGELNYALEFLEQGHSIFQIED